MNNGIMELNYEMGPNGLIYRTIRQAGLMNSKTGKPEWDTIGGEMWHGSISSSSGRKPDPEEPITEVE